jgi:hypothetical protein
MGLAASQARLLFITARKSDVEFSEMKCATKKMGLSRETQDIADDYNRSLNMRKLVYVADGSATSSDAVNLSYDLLMSPNATNTTSQYMLTDASNRVVLSDGYISKLGLSGDSGNLGSMDRAAFLGKFGLDASQFEDAYVAAPATAAPTTPTVDTSNVATNTISQNMSNMAELMSEEQFSEKGSDVLTDPNYELMKAVLLDIDKNISTALADPALTTSQKSKYTKMQTNNAAAKVALELARTSEAANERIGAIASIKYLFAGTKLEDSLAEGGITVRENNVPKGKKGSWHGLNPTEKKNTDQNGYALLAIHKQVLTEDSKLNGFTYNEYYVDNMGSMLASLSLSGAFNAKKDDPGSGETPPPVAQTDQNKADFYTNLYYAVAANGWSRNDKITDSSYLSNQLINGGMQLQKLSSDGSWSQSAMSDPSSPIRNVKDTEGAEQAKIKYDMARDQMNDKDSEIDIEMKNLETERSALDTELDSVKAIITKNIERSFKTFA